MSDYQIKCKNMADGKHLSKFNITDSFFDAFSNSEIKHANINISTVLFKKLDRMHLTISIDGKINKLLCDLCAENISIKISSKTKFLIQESKKQEYSDEIIYIDKNDNKISLKHLLFELIVLSLPNQKQHPLNKKGKRTCNKEMLNLIEQYSLNQHSSKDDRWTELKKLKIKD